MKSEMSEIFDVGSDLIQTFVRQSVIKPSGIPQITKSIERILNYKRFGWKQSSVAEYKHLMDNKRFVENKIKENTDDF